MYLSLLSMFGDMILLGGLSGIVLLDLVLSGDNALVIGAVAATLPRKQRAWAIAFGGGMAILLRIGLTIGATLILQLPYLEAVGAVLVLWVAYRLLAGREGENSENKPQKHRDHRFLFVIASIFIADVSMSVDNILAIGALAGGNFWLIIVGLALSVAVLMIASALVAELIRLLPWLLDIAALVLAWTAASMIASDQMVGPFLISLISGQVTLPLLGAISLVELLLSVFLVGILLLIDIFFLLRLKRKPAPQDLPSSQQPVEPHRQAR